MLTNIRRFDQHFQPRQYTDFDGQRQCHFATILGRLIFTCGRHLDLARCQCPGRFGLEAEVRTRATAQRKATGNDQHRQTFQGTTSQRPVGGAGDACQRGAARFGANLRDARMLSDVA